MANKKVTLVRVCKTDEGWKRLPIVMGKNGKIRPGYALVDNTPTLLTEGYYALRRYEGKRTVYETIGDDAADALAAQQRKSHLLLARDSAASAGAVLVEETGRILLSKRAKTFIQAAEDRGSTVAAAAYRLATDEFLQTTAHTYADQITPEDITAHHLALKKRGCSARTVHNRHMNVKAFLVACGVSADITKMRAPKFDKTLPEIYETSDLNSFLASLSDPYHQLIFNLLLQTGLREQEAMYLEWPDISFATKTLTVHSKPELGFRIKDKEERSVPIPLNLLRQLKEYKAEHPKKRFVIGNEKDKPHTKLLRLLKTLVHDAGLNCGQCEGCRDREECERWFLHKFRATYCTRLLRAGLDLRTVQGLMGHSDLASTMRYLRPQEDAGTQSKINAIVWA